MILGRGCFEGGQKWADWGRQREKANSAKRWDLDHEQNGEANSNHSFSTKFLAGGKICKTSSFNKDDEKQIKESPFWC